MKNVAFHNLGCKTNSYEIEVMQQILQEKGYNVVPFDEMADIYIINTCTVTNIADRKSRQMLHRAKARNPQAIVVAVGCYVQTASEQVQADESIDLAIGNNRKKDIAIILEEYLKTHGISETGNQTKYKSPEEQQEIDKSEIAEASQTEVQPIIDINHTYEYEEMTLHQTAEHTRAYIKIQDGCNQFCSYCIIPFARGRVRSRRMEDIIEEIKGIVAAGYQEIVLTGIHISSYGIDFDEEAWQQGKSVRKSLSLTKNHETQKGKAGEGTEENGRSDYSGSTKLIELVEKIHEIEGLKRIRLGSLEPRIVTEENATRMAALPKLCPHFHLSLQSGCDETLKRMNRHYTAGEYYESVKILRRVFDHPAITTDVIVGFPGETEEEFAVTKAFLEKVGFYEMHIFKYSKRQGTRAAVMPNQVADEIKTLRSNELLAMEKEQSQSFRSRYIGEEAEVLFEETKVINGKEYQLGHTADYVKIALKTEENLSNCLKKVRVTDLLTEEILNSVSMH